MTESAWDRARRTAALAAVTALGAGYAPKAPGTCGSLVALAALALAPAEPWYFAVVGAGVVLTSAGCVLLGRFAERRFGRKDPSAFVLDEVAGMALAGLAWTKPPLHWLLAAFLLFRYFDVRKPLGIRALQGIPHGPGILLDDLVAGAYTLVLVQAAQLLTTGTVVP